MAVKRCLRVLQLIVILLSVCLFGLFIDMLFSIRLTGSLIPSGPSNSAKMTPLLLLVSYDGFRTDYLNRSDRLFAFRHLMSNGVRTRTGLLNSFVTVTAPNHYGIVTGLYEESHGIIENKFFDQKLGRWFDYFVDTSRTDPSMFGGRPLWVLNQEAGRYSGCVMWVGCDVPIAGQRASRYLTYDEKSRWEGRVEAVISWFKDPTEPINFGLLYIEQPDALGHQVGPDSQEIKNMLEKLDAFTGYLLFRLQEEGLLQRMNIIFTSDHGMTSVPAANKIDLDLLVNSSLYDLISGFGGTSWNLLPKAGKEDEVYNAIAHKHPRLKVRRKPAIPDQYHYKNNDRVMPLFLEADLHWHITSKLHNSHSDNDTHGYHGYNNSEPQMQPYFIAIGPSFKSGVVVDSFQNVDIYPLICHLLNLKPDSNNGSLDRVKHLLNNDPDVLTTVANGEPPLRDVFVFAPFNVAFVNFSSPLLLFFIIVFVIFAVPLLAREILLRHRPGPTKDAILIYG